MDVLVFVVPAIVGVLTFFAYKFLAIASNVGDLHMWYGKTDGKGVLLGYKEDGEAYKAALAQIVVALHEHINRDEQALRSLHEKVDKILLRQSEIMNKVEKLCGS